MLAARPYLNSRRLWIRVLWILAVVFALLMALSDDAAAKERAKKSASRHPSGKDRSVEPGGSFPQGKSLADPDDNDRGPERSNRGADKPHQVGAAWVQGPGGLDRADQDSNNGCGNDDDFEDDNEGNCRGLPRAKPPGAKPPPTSKVSPPRKPPLIHPAKPEVPDAPRRKLDRVRRQVVVDVPTRRFVRRMRAGAPMPTTGVDPGLPILLGFVLTGAGGLIRQRARRR